MSTSIFSSWKIRIISAIMLAALIYLTIDFFKKGYEEGRQMKIRAAREAAAQGK